MAAYSPLFLAVTLAGCAYALGRRLGRKPLRVEVGPFRLRGRDLIAVARHEEYRTLRTGPSLTQRIADAQAAGDTETAQRLDNYREVITG